MWVSDIHKVLLGWWEDHDVLGRILTLFRTVSGATTKGISAAMLYAATYSSTVYRGPEG